jgi:hypothetical protein
MFGVVLAPPVALIGGAGAQTRLPSAVGRRSHHSFQPVIVAGADQRCSFDSCARATAPFELSNAGLSWAFATMPGSRVSAGPIAPAIDMPRAKARKNKHAIRMHVASRTGAIITSNHAGGNTAACTAWIIACPAKALTVRYDFPACNLGCRD